MIAGPADVPRIAVEWTAPAECPGREQVAGAVELLSGARVVDPGAMAELDARAEVFAEDSSFRLELTMVSNEGSTTRELEAPSCELLARAAGLVMVVALDPIPVVTRWPDPNEEVDASIEPVVATPAFEPEDSAESKSSEEPGVSDDPREEASVHEPPNRRAPSRFGRVEFGVEPRVGVVAGTLPGVGASVELTAFVGVERLHLRAGGQYRSPRVETLAGNPDAGGRFQLASGGLRICPNVMPARGRLRIPACAGVDLGTVFAEPVGSAVRNGSNAGSLWSSVAFEVGVSVRVSRWISLTAAVEAGVALSRPRFRIDGGGSVHRVGRFAPRGVAGVQFHRRP